MLGNIITGSGKPLIRVFHLQANVGTAPNPSNHARNPVSGPQSRPGQAAGRARSASPAKTDRRNDGEVEKQELWDREVKDLDIELELFRDGPNRSVHSKFALCRANLP